MRKILLILLAGMMLSGSLSAQDSIFIKLDNSLILAKVVEVTVDMIKYKNFNQPDGPIRSIEKSDINKILYEDGTVEEFNEVVKPEEEKNNNYDQYSNYEKPEKTEQTGYENGKYFLVGAGYGNSYGGIGVKFAGRFGGILGFGFHGGIGYLPFVENESSSNPDIKGLVAYSAGFQFFFYKWLYADLQFGVFGQERVEYSYYYYYNYYSYYDYSYKEEALYGPSILVGGDFIFGKHFGFNAASGFSFNINDKVSSSYDVLFAFDIGFIVRF